MRAQNWTWVVVLVVATVVGVAGCAGRPERLPQCTGQTTPINVPADAAGAARGR